MRPPGQAHVDGHGPTSTAGTSIRNFLRPCLLLLLHEHAAYGYELQERLRAFADAGWDHGTVYRALNTMEEEGVVASHWERSASGPQRRRYSLTDSGRRQLHDWARDLERLESLLAGFLERALPRATTSSSQPRRRRPPAAALPAELVLVSNEERVRSG